MRFFCSPQKAQTVGNFTTSLLSLVSAMAKLGAVPCTHLAKNVLEDADFDPFIWRMIGLGFAAGLSLLPAVFLSFIHAYCHLIENKYQNKEYDLEALVLKRDPTLDPLNGNMIKKAVDLLLVEVGLDDDEARIKVSQLTSRQRTFNKSHYLFDVLEMTDPYLNTELLIFLALHYLKYNDTYWEIATTILIVILCIYASYQDYITAINLFMAKNLYDAVDKRVREKEIGSNTAIPSPPPELVIPREKNPLLDEEKNSGSECLPHLRSMMRRITG